jgi:TolB-like protein
MSLFAELKRRHVIRVAAAYLIIGWLLVQVLDLAAESFEAPTWVMKMIITLVVLGFIPTLLFSWAYELTPEGLKKDSEVDKSTSADSQTANKLNVVTLVAVAGLVALIGWQQMNPPVSPPVSDKSSVEATTQTPSAEPELGSTVDDASIAVLPFADMSPEGDQGYFSDGVSEEILNVLAKIEGLRVASRTSAFAYKNSQQRIPEIARELQVRHILEGSVRRAGDTIRVTAQLIDAETDEHLLSETFDRTLTAENVFAIQGDIAQLIATALSERIEIAGIATPITVAADTANLATLDLYYEANSLFLLRGNANLTRAMNLFERIVGGSRL